MLRKLPTLLLLFAPLCSAQLKIDNPDNLPVPHDEAQLAYKVARQRVLEELFGKEKAPPEFEITLKLGCKDPRTGDEYFASPESGGLSHMKQSSEICLHEWNLEKFTYGVMRLTERRLIPARRYRPMLEDALRRLAQVSPVSVADLQKHPAKPPGGP